MSGRGAALCVIAGLFALSGAGLAAAAVMGRRKAPGGLVIYVAGPSAACGAWALLGLAWWLCGGVVS